MKVSVIIPCYNFDEYIEQSILSAVNQLTNFEYEILVRDDLSNDKSQINIERVAYYHPKVKYFKPSENLGFAENIKFLITQSKGEYIAYLDGDDYFTDPNKLQKQVDFMDSHPEYSMTFTGHWNRELGGGYAPDLTPGWMGLVGFENNEVTSENLLETNYVTFGRMFRNEKNLIKDWIMDLPFFDWPLNYEISRIGKIKFLNFPSGVYRIHTQSLYSTTSEEIKRNNINMVKNKIAEIHKEYETKESLG